MTDNKGDLISRKALKEAFEKVYPLASNEMGGVVNRRIYEFIDNAPTVKIPVARWDSYCEGQRVGYDKCIDTIIKLFNKYIPLLVHIDGKISPVKNTSKQECYDLLYEIQELIEWRKLLYKNNMEANNEDHD